MARTNAADVKVLLGDCGDNIDDAIVTAIIADASMVVNSVLAECTILSDEELTGIEKWLTAHMIASSGLCRQTTEETLGEASVKYAGEWGKKMESTSFGQMVLTLDRCGAFANTGKRAATMRAIKSCT